MKRAGLIIVMLLSFSAQAGISNFFDFAKFGQGLLLIMDSVNESLEHLHVLQKENLDVEDQWKAMCWMTQALNKSTENFNHLLKEHDFDQRTCVPLTNALNLQQSIIKNCKNYYDKTVQLNNDYVFEKLQKSLEELQKIAPRCYPFLF